MEISESSQGSVLVVSPRGRLDSTTSPAFEQLVRAKLADGHRKVVVDLDALDYVSSAGLRILMVLAKALKGERGQIALCRLQEPVREVFRISGFDRIFTILPSLDDTVARVGADG